MAFWNPRASWDMKWKKNDADGTGPVGGPTIAAGQMMYDSV